MQDSAVHNTVQTINQMGSNAYPTLQPVQQTDLDTQSFQSLLVDNVPIAEIVNIPTELVNDLNRLEHGTVATPENWQAIMRELQSIDQVAEVEQITLPANLKPLAVELANQDLALISAKIGDEIQLQAVNYNVENLLTLQAFQPEILMPTNIEANEHQTWVQEQLIETEQEFALDPQVIEDVVIINTPKVNITPEHIPTQDNVLVLEEIATSVTIKDSNDYLLDEEIDLAFTDMEANDNVVTDIADAVKANPQQNYNNSNSQREKSSNDNYANIAPESKTNPKTDDVMVWEAPQEIEVELIPTSLTDNTNIKQLTDKLINANDALLPSNNLEKLQLAIRQQQNSDQTIKSLVINLEPADLGAMEMAFQYEPDGLLKVNIACESFNTLNMLKNSEQKINAILAENGFNSANLNFSFHNQGNQNEPQQNFVHHHQNAISNYASSEQIVNSTIKFTANGGVNIMV